MIEKFQVTNDDIERIIRRLLREKNISRMDFIKAQMLTFCSMADYFKYESLTFEDFEEFLEGLPESRQKKFATCVTIGKALEKEIADFAETGGYVA